MKSIFDYLEFYGFHPVNVSLLSSFIFNIASIFFSLFTGHLNISPARHRTRNAIHCLFRSRYRLSLHRGKVRARDSLWSTIVSDFHSTLCPRYFSTIVADRSRRPFADHSWDESRRKRERGREREDGDEWLDGRWRVFRKKKIRTYT